MTPEGLLSEQESLFSSLDLHLQYYFYFINIGTVFITYLEREKFA